MSKVITEEGFELSSEQVEALITIENSTDNYFITGKAGTGKSVLLKAYVERARKANKRVVILASTGVAAEHVEGETIHSFLGVITPIMDVATVRDMEVSNEDEEA